MSRTKRILFAILAMGTSLFSENLLKNPEMTEKSPDGSPAHWSIRCKNKSEGVFSDGKRIHLDTEKAGSAITMIQRHMSNEPAGRKMLRFRYSGTGEIRAYMEWRIQKPDGKKGTSWTGPVWRKADASFQTYQFFYNASPEKGDPYLIIQTKENAAITLDSLYYGPEPDFHVRVVPADIRRHGKLVLARGFTQGISLFLHTTLKAVEKDVNVQLDFTLPDGVTLAGCARGSRLEGNSLHYSLPPRLVVGPGQGGGEWRCTYVALQVSKTIGNDAEMTVTPIVDGNRQPTQSYAMRFVEMPASPAPKLKKLRHMIYDYGFFTIPDKDDAMATFFQHCGFNYANQGVWKGMISSSYIHNSKFWNPNLPLAPSADGKIYRSLNHGDPQSFISKGAEAVAGKQIREIAQTCKSNILHFDYEPFGYGDFFSEESIQKFLGQTGHSREKFDAFRAEYAKLLRKMAFDVSPENREIFLQWIDFTTQQSVDFLQILSTELKKCNPALKIEITQTNSCGPRDSATLAFGNDNSAMARVCDMVQPQIYNGYDDAAAKYAILRMREWKQRVHALNPNCQILPLLLKSWSGAKSGNQPEMLYLQALGGIAEGMHGIGWYYLQNLDGDDMLMLHKLTCDIARHEDFYASGIRCDNEFSFTGMPQESRTILERPYIKKAVNPAWHYTAHRLDGKTLLTLFNLSSRPLEFRWKHSQKESTRVLPPVSAEFIIVQRQ